MKKLLKPLIWLLVLVMSVLLVTVFGSGGCRTAATQVEEPAVEEPVVEEFTGGPEEEAAVEKETSVDEEVEEENAEEGSTPDEKTTEE
jgi:hypothetical protein